MSWGFFEGSVIQEHLAAAPEPKYQKLLNNAEKHDPLAGITDEMRERIIHKDHALLGWKTTLQLEMKEQYRMKKWDATYEDKCDFAIGIEEFFMERVSLAFTMNNPWVEKFNDM